MLLEFAHICYADRLVTLTDAQNSQQKWGEKLQASNASNAQESKRYILRRDTPL
jgi:hypothetical protein